jgi:hypothetical protein
MDPYATRGQSRIRQRDIDGLVRTYGFLTAASLAALERQRGCQAEADVARLLKQHGVQPMATGSFVARLRQTIGAVLVRSGERLAGVPRSAVVPEPAPAAGTLGTAG